MLRTSNKEYPIEVKNNRLRTNIGRHLIEVIDFYPIVKGFQVVIRGTEQGLEFTSITSPLVSLKEGAGFMVCTQHSTYTFMVKNGCLQTIYGHYAIAVTELHGLVPGERLTVKGNRLGISGEIPCQFITSPIVEILP